jgi:tRNA 2-thiocytidine biosynthesis protein TtcA
MHTEPAISDDERCRAIDISALNRRRIDDAAISTGLSLSVAAIQKKLRRQTGKAIEDFQMIREGDRVMVCVSGGADSHTLLDTLLYLQRVAPVRFELIAVNLDQKQPGFPSDVLPNYLETLGVPYRIVEQDTYSVVKDKIPEGKTTCSLCSRLRRAILYKTAKEVGATRVALGHHRDDILQTFLLNLFYGGQLKAMPPRLLSDDEQHVVIRPLAYCSEDDIKKYAKARKFPIIPCDLCGSQPNLKRQAMKALINSWEKEDPLRIRSMFTAMTNVTPSHLLDRSLHDFFEPQPGFANDPVA